jgi:hypothetical protein
MIQVKGDKHTTGKPDRQTKNVDEREDLVFHQASPRDLQVIFDHGFDFEILKFGDWEIVPANGGIPIQLFPISPFSNSF